MTLRDKIVTKIWNNMAHVNSHDNAVIAADAILSVIADSVVPLEWVDEGEDAFFAGSIFGEYYVDKRELFEPCGRKSAWANSSEAKIKGGERNTRRILSAFSPQPSMSPQEAAKVLRGAWIEGTFETTGDEAMQGILDAGITCQYTLIENWLNAIAIGGEGHE